MTPKKHKEPLRGERLLKTAINQILLHPETWNQLVWHSSCGTKHCLAGWCQILAGFPANVDLVIDHARTGLGITDGEASYLFAGSITLQEMHHYAKNFRVEGGYDDDGWNKFGMSKDYRRRTFPPGADGLLPFDV